MGDASDHADVGRFMRTAEGQQVLNRFRDGLIGKKIAEVAFTHNGGGIGIELSFEDRDLLDLAEALNAFSVETLRDRYMRILDREYYVDFPQRQPTHARTNSNVVPTIERLVCPECGAREAFAIETWQRLTFHPDGTTTEGDEGQQWDTDSPCRCDACNHEGVVQDFLDGEKP